MEGCRGVTYNSTESGCYYHNCSATSDTLDTTITFYKRECNFQHCPSFKLTVMPGFEGNCNVISTEAITSYIDCQQRCLDMDGCRGATYSPADNTCTYHNCSTYIGSLSNQTFIQRDCDYQDCPEFDFKVYHDTKGDMCVPLDDSGFDVILDFQHCLSRCLDIVNCRATTYDSVANSCTFYQSCANTSTSVGDKYVEITCVSEPLRLNTQKCYHCDLDYVECNSNFTYGATYTTHNACAERCDNYTDCLTAVYDGKPAVECFLYQCPLTVRSYGKVTFRKTNTSDCLEYEIRFYEGFSGGCSVLGEMTTESSASYCFSRCLELSACKDCLKYEIFTVPAAVGMCTVMQTINGGISGPFCLEKCLDTPGCMGATYNKDSYRCDLHDCNNYTYAGASNSFFKRRCIDSSETWCIDIEKRFTSMNLDTEQLIENKERVL
ncbi:hypothetical protein ACF0H5_009035 [Mactra antiquata]